MSQSANNVELHLHRGTLVFFTKLWVLALPIRQVLFLDLDVLPRCNPAELFQIAAPAGSYHGTLRYAVYNKNRGFSYPRDEGACFNAGVLRLDLRPNRECRHMELNDVMSRAAQIVRPSALPEQFLLAEHYHRWNLLDVSWNFEVGCSVSYDSDSGVLSEVMPLASLGSYSFTRHQHVPL